MYDSHPFTHAETKNTSCPITGHNHESTINESKLPSGHLLTNKNTNTFWKKNINPWMPNVGSHFTPHFPNPFFPSYIPWALGQPPSALIPAGLGKKRWPLCCNRSSSKVAASRLAAARTFFVGIVALWGLSQSHYQLKIINIYQYIYIY